MVLGAWVVPTKLPRGGGEKRKIVTGEGRGGGRGAQGRFVREGDLLGHSPLPIWSANSHLLLP